MCEVLAWKLAGQESGLSPQLQTGLRGAVSQAHRLPQTVGLAILQSHHDLTPCTWEPSIFIFCSLQLVAGKLMIRGHCGIAQGAHA